MTKPAVCPLPTARSHPLQPPDGIPVLAEQGAGRVTFPNGVESWLFTRYDDVRMVLSDRRFSARKDSSAPEMRIEETILGMDVPGNMVVQDGADHLRLRRPLARGFVVRRINELRPRIQEIVDEHLDAMEKEGRSADLVQALCLPVPSLVIAELLGVPSEHQALFQRAAAAMLGVQNTKAEYEEVATELGVVLAGVMADKREKGITDDLLGLLVNDENPLDTMELLFLGMGLLVAGHETTSTFMALFVLTLFQNPDQLEILVRDPDKADSVVEELMRYTITIGSGGLVRRATEDVQVGDVLVRKGEWVATSGYANMDPDLCPNSKQLDIERPPVPHVAFGFGPHQCLGQNLARAELQIMLKSLFTRFPNLRPAADLEEIPFRTETLVYGPRTLPVVW